MTEQHADSQNWLPLPLILVASIFLVHGTIATMEMLVAYSRGTPSINFGAVSLLIGFGLLLRFRFARLLAIVATSFFAILVLVFAALVINGAPASMDWFGNPTTDVPGWLVLLGGTVVLAIAAWQLEVLLRPSIASLFGLPTRSHEAAISPPPFSGKVGRHD